MSKSKSWVWAVLVVGATFPSVGRAQAPSESPSSEECTRTCRERCAGDRRCVRECVTRCSACEACFTFDAPLPIGTQYGSSVGTTSGSVVLASNGITLAVEDFYYSYSPLAWNFGVVTVNAPSSSFGTDQVLGVNNINVAFDFSGLPALPSEVRLEFQDIGGVENLSVNGDSPYYIGSLEAAPTTIGGASVSVYTSPITNGRLGVLVVRGMIKTLVIGGQEFSIDNVCAKP